jgi:hypothetical protein
MSDLLRESKSQFSNPLKIKKDSYGLITIQNVTLKRFKNLFVKNKAVEIVKHLKDFNLVADNYEAIADLLQLSRGAIWGEHYGI